MTWSDCISESRSSSGWAPLPLPGVGCSEDSRGDLLIGRDGSSAVRFRPVTVAFEFKFAGADKGNLKATRESIVQVGWSWFQVVRKGESRSRSQNGSSHASASECRLTVPSWENLAEGSLPSALDSEACSRPGAAAWPSGASALLSVVVLSCDVSTQYPVSFKGPRSSCQLAFSSMEC